MQTKTKIAKSAKRTSKPAVKAAPAAAASSGKFVALKTIFPAGTDLKLVRRRLRAAVAAGKLAATFHNKRERWSVPNARVADVRSHGLPAS